MELVAFAVVVAILVLVQVRRRGSPLQRPGEPRDTHRDGGGPGASGAAPDPPGR